MRDSTETVYVFKYDDRLNDLIQQWRNNNNKICDWMRLILYYIRVIGVI